ncbi:MAG: RHS repeat-associated core domain-containing protein [Arachidicoccus sp.]|nr:RHS repeat-associated core domain-containing protein [Arachidicoccus sp.]
MITGHASPKNAAKQLNGSIAGMVWKNNADGAVRKYDFTYDAVNNLTGADFNQYTGSSFNKSADYNFSVSNLTYDANGNLLTMNQTGKKADGTTGTIDQLSYSYPTFSGFSGNKLSKVTDGIPQDGGGSGDFQDGTNGDDDYSYDDNGNLITDKNKNIQNVNYNFLNLPQKITTANATIDYLYDAGGAELQKKVTTATTVTTTTYIGAAVYQQSSLNGASVVDTLQFFGMEEGRVRPAYNAQLNTTYWAYDYFLSDHLGNTRMIITDDYNAPGPILEADNYYPFGLKMAAISYSYGTHVKNPYQYGSGSEFNDVTGWNEFALRDYDPQTGRFVQQDPFDQFASPYLGMGNDPINNADPSGGFSVPGALIGSGTGFVLGMAYGFFHNNDGGSMLKDGLIGAAIGAAAGGFSGDLFGGAGGAGNASISNVLNAVNSKAANIASIAVHAASGAAQMTGNFGVDNAYREQSFDGFNAEVISHGGGGSEAPDQFSNNENNGPGPRIPFLGPIIIKPGSPIWNFLTRISPFTPFEELLLGRDVGENFGQKISRKNILNHLASNPLALITPSEFSEESVLYRGGESLEMSATDINASVNKKTGLMKERGISLNSDPFNTFVQSKGGAYRVDLSTVPKELKIIRTSGSHFEIVPREAGKMNLETYQNLLKQVQLFKYNNVKW